MPWLSLGQKQIWTGQNWTPFWDLSKTSLTGLTSVLALKTSIGPKLFWTHSNCFWHVLIVSDRSKQFFIRTKTIVHYHWTPFKELWSAQNNLDRSKIVSDLHKDKALADLMAYSCIILGPRFIYNWSISHILEHKFFCLGRFCSWATFESGFCGHFFLNIL